MQALLIVLSVTAGCTDIIGFLGLHGLFTAQITGNLVILAADIVGSGQAEIAKMLSVPVFIVTISLTTLLASSFESIGIGSLRPLLLLQFLLLVGFLVLCIAAGPHIDPSATNAILAGLVGVSAMAVQNAVLQISLKESPPTAVMTTNVTHFTIDVGKVMFGDDPAEVANARNRAAGTLPVIIGFAVGCGIGAACEAAFGMWSLALPASLALLAFALGSAAGPNEEKGVPGGSIPRRAIPRYARHDKWRSEFYSKLLRPDTKTSCCNLADCRPTEIRTVGDHYEVMKDGRWITAPLDKNVKVTAPDSGAHICGSSVLRHSMGA